MWSWIGDGYHLVHRTQTVDYQVLKGLSLVALGGFFIVWSLLSWLKEWTFGLSLIIGEKLS